MSKSDSSYDQATVHDVAFYSEAGEIDIDALEGIIDQQTQQSWDHSESSGFGTGSISLQLATLGGQPESLQQDSKVTPQNHRYGSGFAKLFGKGSALNNTFAGIGNKLFGREGGTALISDGNGGILEVLPIGVKGTFGFDLNLADALNAADQSAYSTTLNTLLYGSNEQLQNVWEYNDEKDVRRHLANAKGYRKRVYEKLAELAELNQAMELGELSSNQVEQRLEQVVDL